MEANFYDEKVPQKMQILPPQPSPIPNPTPLHRPSEQPQIIVVPSPQLVYISPSRPISYSPLRYKKPDSVREVISLANEKVLEMPVENYEDLRGEVYLD